MGTQNNKRVNFGSLLIYAKRMMCRNSLFPGSQSLFREAFFAG
jgi:hypothetical protein